MLEFPLIWAVIHKHHKGYKDSFSMETHQIEDVDREFYTVDWI